MNIKAMIFSGIMVALVGAMIGLAVSHISQRELRTRRVIITGAAVGFVLGAIQEAVKEEKRQKRDEYED